MLLPNHPRSETWRPTLLEAWHLDVLWRAYLLRKARLLPVVLADCNALWVCGEPADAWGTRHRISWEGLRRLVEEAEGLIRVAKPVKREEGRKVADVRMG